MSLVSKWRRKHKESASSASKSWGRKVKKKQERPAPAVERQLESLKNARNATSWYALRTACRWEASSVGSVASWVDKFSQSSKVRFPLFQFSFCFWARTGGSWRKCRFRSRPCLLWKDPESCSGSRAASTWLGKHLFLWAVGSGLALYSALAVVILFVAETRRSFSRSFLLFR